MNAKTVRVQLDFEDGTILILEGEEAAKWYDASVSQAVLCDGHGMKFPDLKWQKFTKVKNDEVSNL